MSDKPLSGMTEQELEQEYKAVDSMVHITASKFAYERCIKRLWDLDAEIKKRVDAEGQK